MRMTVGLPVMSLLLGAALPCVAAAQSWTGIGGSGDYPGLGVGAYTGTAVKVDALDRPVVAWDEQQVFLRRWNGTAWVSLGTSGSGGGISQVSGGYGLEPDLAVDAAGNPVVVWDTYAPGDLDQVYLKRWNGSAWIELGGSASGGGLTNNPADPDHMSYMPKVALNAAGYPTVAWASGWGAGNYEIFVRRWNGSSWEELGGSASGGGISSTAAMSLCPSLRLDHQGYPVVSWEEFVTPGDRQIYLKRWNGSAWVALGGSASGYGLSACGGDDIAPALALDANDLPVVAWSCGAQAVSGFHNTHVRRWNGTAWVGVGGSDVGKGLSYSVSSSPANVEVGPQGRIVVSWEEELPGPGLHSEVAVARWTGTQWETLAGNGGPALEIFDNWSLPSSLALKSSGEPMVSGSDVDSAVYLREYSPVTEPPPSPGSTPEGGAGGGGGGGGGGCSARPVAAPAFIALVLLGGIVGGSRRSFRRS